VLALRPFSADIESRLVFSLRNILSCYSSVGVLDPSSFEVGGWRSDGLP
jgi:hypothetical protein